MTTLDVHKSVVGSENIVFVFLDETLSVHTFVFIVWIENMKKEHSDNVLCFVSRYTFTYYNVFLGWICIPKLSLMVYTQKLAYSTYINHKNTDSLTLRKIWNKNFWTSISQHQFIIFITYSWWRWPNCCFLWHFCWIYANIFHWFIFLGAFVQIFRTFM